MNKYTNRLYISIYLLSFTKNSMLVAGSTLEIYFNVIIYFIVFLITMSSIPRSRNIDQVINGDHLFLLVITFLGLLFLDSGHLQFFTIIYLVALMRINDNLDFFLQICKIIAILLFIILFVQITGIYHFPLLKNYNIVKSGNVVLLGFRNVNTYGGYCYNCLLVFYLFREKKWIILTSIVLILSTYYTKSRTPIFAIIIIFILNLFRYKYVLRFRTVNFFVLINFITVFIGFMTIFYAKDLMKIVIFGKFNLNQLSSTRLFIIYNLTRSLTYIQWLIGSSSDVVDSFYLYFITFYGIIFTSLIFYVLIKKYRILIRNDYIIHLIILTVILVAGLFEVQLSPFLPSGILFFMILLYPKWVGEKVKIKNNTDKKLHFK